MKQNTTESQDFFRTKVCLSLTVLILFWYCVTIAFAAPERDLNLAVASIASEVIAKLPKDSGEANLALIPLNATEPDLKTVSRVLTSLLASQLAEAIGKALIGSEHLDWRQYPTDGSLLTPERVKQYGKSLACQWLITGHITKLELGDQPQCFFMGCENRVSPICCQSSVIPCCCVGGTLYDST